MKYLPLFMLAFFSAFGNGFAQDMSNVLGVCHVDGKYYFTQNDYLDEGADQVLATGSKVLKTYLMPRFRYPWNSTWPKDIKDLRDVAQSRTYYQSVFEKPFTTYILTAYCVGHDDHYWTTGINDQH